MSLILNVKSKLLVALPGINGSDNLSFKVLDTSPFLAFNSTNSLDVSNIQI